MEFFEETGTISIFEKCRLCQETTGIHSIRSDFMLHKKLEETMNIIGNDDLEYMMPSMVCDICYTKVDEIYKFTKSAIKVNNELRQLITAKGAFEDEAFTVISNDKIATNRELVQYFEQLKAADLEIKTEKISIENKIEVEEKCIIDDVEIVQENEPEGKNEYVDFFQEISGDCSNFSLITCNNKPDINIEPTDINRPYIQENKEEITTITDEISDEIVGKNRNMEPSETRDFNDITDNTFICDICTKIFNTKLNLRRHYTIHTNSKSVLCETCGKKFKRKSALICHEKTHLSIKLYKCSMCDIEFSTRSNLRTHLRKYHEKVRFYCSQCTREFLDKFDLERHEQSHKGIREFECKHCPSKFYTNKELLKHQRYHQGLKNYKCQICFKAYFESHHLTVHMRSHSGERPYKCKIQGCNKSFIESSKLKRHRESLHAKLLL